MPITNNLTIGKTIENLALVCLQEQNLELLERNFRSKYGEIDLIFKNLSCNNKLIFVEVRYRKSTHFGEI